MQIGDKFATSDNRAFLSRVLRAFVQIPRRAQNCRYAQPLGGIDGARGRS
jgi:hypothetical protein